MHCIIGLGNPEARYARTRHNIGFQIADHLTESLKISYRSGKGEYVYGKGVYRFDPVLIVKPTTYMNRSGLAVQHVKQYFKVNSDSLLVILDDLDLPIGTLRFREKGCDGGNKGLRSIISQSGTEKIARLKVGIRNRDRIANPSSYVLSNFNRKEKVIIPELTETAAEAVLCWITNGITTAMDRFNRHFDFN